MNPLSNLTNNIVKEDIGNLYYEDLVQPFFKDKSLKQSHTSFNNYNPWQITSGYMCSWQNRRIENFKSTIIEIEDNENFWGIPRAIENRALEFITVFDTIENEDDFMTIDFELDIPFNFTNSKDINIQIGLIKRFEPQIIVD